MQQMWGYSRALNFVMAQHKPDLLAHDLILIPFATAPSLAAWEPASGGGWQLHEPQGHQPDGGKVAKHHGNKYQVMQLPG